MAHASFQPPPEAVTTIIAKQEKWPATLSAIGSMAAQTQSDSGLLRFSNQQGNPLNVTLGER